MNQITRNNYEEYILEYADNALSVDLMQEMESFLNLHPDIAAEVLSFRNIKLTPDPATAFEGKEDLLRPTESKTSSLSSSLLKVVAVGVILSGIGLFIYLSETTDVINSHSRVNVKQSATQREVESHRGQVDHTTKIKGDQLDNHTISPQDLRIASNTSTDTQSETQVDPSSHDDLHIQTVEAPQMTQGKQAQQVTQPILTGPIYQPSAPHQRQGVSVQSQDEGDRSTGPQPNVSPQVFASEGSSIRTQEQQIQQLATIESLPLTDQLSSLMIQSDEITIPDLIASKRGGSILKSIIKSTGLSREIIVDISESLRPSFALAEVQLVPTYLKENQIALQRK